MGLSKSLNRFEEIAAQTGILTNNSEVEPNSGERDELWDITSVFTEKIYEQDIDKNFDQNEVNKLSHYAIVALHWNDLLLNDERFSYDNGRFRRDTIALAVCLFTRISRDYKEYEFLKSGWIMPHLNFSLLMWTMRSIIDSNNDNIFHQFEKSEAQKAMDLFMDLLAKDRSIIGYVNMSDVPDVHPLRDIWWEIYRQFNSARIPYQFALNYIWSGPGLPGGLGLLPRDREMNKAYLKKEIKHKQFPSEWLFCNDLAYVYLFFAAETDGDLADAEIDQIKIKIGEWTSSDDADESKNKVDQYYNLSKSQFDKDRSKERFSFALENIRRHFIIEYEEDWVKTNKQLSWVLKDLVDIAKADEVIIKEEYQLVEEIRSVWGIDLKLFDEDTETKFNSDSIASEEDSKDEDEPIVASGYLEEYPGELYCENDHWWRSGRPLRIMNFPNVFGSTGYKYENLFRRFTQDEVNLIINKIKSTGSLIYLNFVREILSEKFDLRGMKNPFWFIPFVAYGNDIAGVFYFEQNGIYGNYNKPTKLSMVIHCDLWTEVDCEPGYNGLFNNFDSDLDVLSSLRIDFEYQGEGRNINIVETNGKDYASTLPIAQAIWDNVWNAVVQKSKAAGCFLLGPPPIPEFFNSWEELLKWASSENDNGSPGESESDSSKEG